MGIPRAKWIRGLSCFLFIFFPKLLSLFIGLSGLGLCNSYTSGPSPWGLKLGQKLEVRLGTDLQFPRRALWDGSLRKAALHLTAGAALHLAAAQVLMALGHGGGQKERGRESPTGLKSKKVWEGKKEARSPYINKEKQTVCSRILSVQDFDLQPARLYIIAAPKRAGAVQTPRQPFELELCRRLLVSFRSSFWPCKYPLLNKSSGSS